MMRSVGAVSSFCAVQGAAGGEWRSYAGDMWGTKYAPLDQITADNFGDLEVAWRWRTADSHLPFEDEHGISLIPAETLFDRLEAAEPGRWGSGRDARQGLQPATLRGRQPAARQRD